MKKKADPMFRKAQLKLFLVITSILLAVFIGLLASVNVITEQVMSRQSEYVLEQIAAGIEYNDKEMRFTLSRPEDYQPRKYDIWKNEPPQKPTNKNGEEEEPPKETTTTTSTTSTTTETTTTVTTTAEETTDETSEEETEAQETEEQHEEQQQQQQQKIKLPKLGKLKFNNVPVENKNNSILEYNNNNKNLTLNTYEENHVL